MTAKIPERTIVLIDLRAGFGVEDIAMRRSIPVARVRETIREFRRCGILANIRWGEVA